MVELLTKNLFMTKTKSILILFAFVLLGMVLSFQPALANCCPGKITVCKIVDGTAPAGSVFSLDLGFDTAVFTTPLTLNADFLGSDGVNDAQCISYDNLPYAEYAYLQEAYPSGWQTPLYNDQWDTPVSSLSDFFEFGANENSNGIIKVDEARPERTLALLNSFQGAESFNVSGKIFHDLNGNMVDDSEAGIQGRTLVLKDGDILKDTAISDESGNYLISGIVPGNYQVCLDPVSGWEQTYPSACHSISITDANLSGYNFGTKEIPALPGKITVC